MDSPGKITPSRAVSPEAQKSPVNEYLCNLSPLKPVKAPDYRQSLSEADFLLPPPVFTSPYSHLPEHESSILNRDEIVTADSTVNAQWDTKLNVASIFGSEKDTSSYSPSSWIDKHLCEPVVGASNDSANVCLQGANGQLLHSGFIGPKETVKRIDGTDDDITEKGGFERLTSQEQADVALPSSSHDFAETSGNQTERLNSVTEPTMHLAADSGSQHHQQYIDQNTGGQYDTRDYASQQITESLPIAETYEDRYENRRPASRGFSKEANEYQGCTRRHLTFEAAYAPKNINNFEGSSSSNMLHDAAIHGSVTNLNWQGSSRDESGGISSYRPITCLQSTYPHSSVQPDKMVRPTRDDRISSTPAPIPSGSLYLNSIGKSVSNGLDIISRKDDSPLVMLNENQPASCKGNTYFTQDADIFEELNVDGPKKKRKKAISTAVKKDCTHCNCQRSQCLKLYCECFRAGVHCVDSCGCETCYNKPENEDTIMEVRRRIQTNDPIAFAPKIVNKATHTPANIAEDRRQTTPSSARHKRGCNCKKSKCRKKYCECYQGEVGCSDGCRCEDCQNSFGTKQEALQRRDEILANLSHKMDFAAPRKDCVKSAGHDQFSPRWENYSDSNHSTPIFQSGVCTEVPQAQLHLGSTLQPSVNAIFQSGVCTKVPQDQLHLGSTLQPSVNAIFQSGVCTKFPQDQLHLGSTLQPSVNAISWPNSMTQFTPPLYESHRPYEFGSHNSLYDIIKNGVTPEILKEISTSTKAVKTSSPNKKRVLPLQPKSEDRGPKFNLFRPHYNFPSHAFPSSYPAL